MKFLKLVKLIGLLLIIGVTSGCVALFTGPSKVKVASTSSEVKLTIKPVMGVDIPPEENRLALVPQRANTIRAKSTINEPELKAKDTISTIFKNTFPAYWVLQEKDGYKSSASLLFPTKYNSQKLTGYGLAAATNLLQLGLLYRISLAASDNNSEEAGGMTFGLSMVSFYFWPIPWIYMTQGPKKVFGSHYELPELQPLPKKKEGEMNISVGTVAVNIPKGKPRFEHFESKKEMDKNNSMDIQYYDEDWIEKETGYEEDVNEALAKYNYFDSTNVELSESSTNRMALNISISDLIEVELYNGVRAVKLTAEWKLMNPYKGVPVKARKISVLSQLFNERKNDDLFEKMVADALENGTIDFLNNSEVKSLVTISANPNPMLNWKKIDIHESLFAQEIGDAAKSVVTIVTKDGHGSGCVISHDGLIVTNYHVAGDSGKKVEVIFEDGKKDSGLVIRSNPLNDLSLIKSERMGLVPLKLNFNDSNNLGSTVYTIGTPKDIELGQTITKGIISGKRIFDSKQYIQSDANISPGNSGGAMLDKEGSLIGIVNAKFVGKGIEGIGFSIPVKYLTETLKLNFYYN